jgi:hypothetical protein
MRSDAPSVDSASEVDGSRGDTDGPVVRGTLGSLLFVLVIWLVVLYALITAFGFHPSARVIPQVAGVPTLVGSTIMLAREVAWWRARRRGELEVSGQGHIRGELESFAWFAAYTAGIFTLGFAIASPLFMLAFLRIYGQESWRRTIMLTVLVVGVIVWLFDGYMNISVYEGWLPGQLH